MILDSLNDAQRQAATIDQGYAVVFAGAGSGKTRVITTRIAWLIDRGVRPWEILAVTFTNKAASEMKARLLAMCPQAERALVTTFHSACAKWLREFAVELGFTGNFSILDESDSLSMIRKIVKNAQFPIEKEATPSQLKSAISHLKTLGFLPPDYAKQPKIFQDTLPTGGLDVFRAYQEALALSNSMDFGDLILYVLLLFKTNPKVKKALEERYKYIMVDEYQDTNQPQIALIQALGAKHGNVFVVGDDDQSIYSWRGAVASNILEFRNQFLNVQECKLEENYRSSANIVDAAAAVVSHNQVRAEKTLKTSNALGEKIDFRYESDGEFEAWWVAKTIQDERETYPYQDVALFYRTNSQSRLLEDALRKERIPYQIYGGMKFYERAEIKDIISYLKLMVNPRDNVAFIRAMSTPQKGLGDAIEQKLQGVSDERQISYWQAAEYLSEQQIPRVSNKLKAWCLMLSDIVKGAKDLELSQLVEYLLEKTNYDAYLDKKFPDQARDKLDNVMELASALAEFQAQSPDATLAQWLQDVSLASDTEGDVLGVSLMSLHLAKGLEFERVYMVGFEDGLLPHFNSLGDPQSLEEERRLCYVGMTRARKKLSLVAAEMRRTWGEVTANSISRFFREIPEKHLNLLSDLPHSQNSVFLSKASKSDLDSSEFTYDYEDQPSNQARGQPDLASLIGCRTHHPTYGDGTIEQLEGNFGKVKVIVKFDEVGLRRVDVRHLRI